MTFDADAAYLAVRARDARFDGRLFVGVTSTGVYCRPICRVRTPMQRNCRFFVTAAQAEAAAFRPCLKCRPEIAPGPGLPWTAMEASRTLARQAALALDADRSEEDGVPTVAAVAARLGISDRHLRRIFIAEHGVGPLQYAMTRRLLLAKQLLTDTRLPMAQVALTSGFRSLRRFNAAFAASYRMQPARLRSAGATPAGHAVDPVVCLTLGYRAPYDLPALLRFFAQRAIPGIEAVEGRTVRRSVRAGTLGASAGWIEATFLREADRVRLTFSPALAGSSARIVAATRRWLDLDASPAAIDDALAALPGAPGLRLPGTLDSFELMVRAVLGQQVTVAGARTLARRLVEGFGEPALTPWPAIDRSFPSPSSLAAMPADTIAALGILPSRAAAIVAVAQAWPGLAPLLRPDTEPGALIDALCRLPGIGAWTAHYVAMRGLGWPDAFPPGDVAVLKAMKQCLGTSTAREAATRAAAWQPWRSYAVLRLWNTLGAPT